MITIEPLSLKTIAGLVEVEVASVKQWYEYHTLVEWETKDYSELSHEQRWFHGGPTMDKILLERYIEDLKREIFNPLEWYVAMENGRVIGYTAFIIGDSPLLGKHGYLDLLLVHPEKRRKGVAKKLLAHVEQLAKNKGCKSLFVYPEELEGPSGRFYQHIGFKQWKDKYELTIDTAKSCEAFNWLASSKKLENTWDLKIGWIASPSKNWILLHTTFLNEFFEQKKITKKIKDEEGNEAIIGVINHHPIFHTGMAFIWLTNSGNNTSPVVTEMHIKAIRHLGRIAGLEKITLVFFEDQLRVIKKWKIEAEANLTVPWLKKKIER